MGLDPHDAASAGEAFEAGITEEGALSITFVRRTNDRTLTIEPQSGPDLQLWNSGPLHLEQADTATPVDAEHEEVTYNDLNPTRTGDARFVRLMLAIGR